MVSFLVSLFKVITGIKETFYRRLSADLFQQQNNRLTMLVGSSTIRYQLTIFDEFDHTIWS